MPNNINAYSQIFYAQEGLIALESALGLAARVHRGYDPEPQVQGDTIQIKKPSSFVAQNAPSTAQDLETSKISIILSEWKEVKFGLTDKELTLSNEELINEHIRPAVYALADEIDKSLAAQIVRFPYHTVSSSPPSLDDIADVRGVLFDNKVPLQDPQSLHCMVDGKMETALLKQLGGKNISGSQVDAARHAGHIGHLSGLEVFANQNTPRFTTQQMTDSDGVAGVALKGANTITVTGVDASGSVKVGDTFTIAGHSQAYAVTQNATATTGTISIQFEPGLQAATAGSEVLSFAKLSGERAMNFGFHRGAIALAMAPLSTLGAQLGGAQMAVASDPKSNLTLRSRMYYVGGTSRVEVALDVLYGFKVLDFQKGVRLYGPAA